MSEPEEPEIQEVPQKVPAEPTVVSAREKAASLQRIKWRNASKERKRLVLKKARNKGKLVRQKQPLKPKDIWAIRIRLQMGDHRRDLALFNLALDSKLRACDLVTLRVRDVMRDDQVFVTRPPRTTPSTEGEFRWS